MFFSDNGSTAVEVAVKIAVAVRCVRTARPKRTRFVALEGAFHGETVGATSLGGVEVFRRPFAGILFDCMHVASPGDPDAYARAFDELGARRRAARPTRSPPSCSSRACRARRACACTAPSTCATRASSATVTKSRSYSTKSSAATAAPGRCGRANSRGLAGSAVHGQGVFGGHAADGGDARDRAHLPGVHGRQEPRLLLRPHLLRQPARRRRGARGTAHVPRRKDPRAGPGEVARDRRARSRRSPLSARNATARPRHDRRRRSRRRRRARRVTSAHAGWRVYEAARRRGVYLRPLGNVVYVAPPLNIPDADLDELLGKVREAIEEVVKG